ncbi:unnamed protein product [Gongylonema pulchrum]|uniref:KTSC domain-containing protein n=1 Tax=Gongylonema pulchrum TaxID=637853 RepID=A0A183EBA2_9BILA|nr:unnamed protein product [Gongylonema pulchrum]
MHRSTYANSPIMQYMKEQTETSIQAWLDEAARKAQITVTDKKIDYVNRTDFDELLASETGSFIIDGIPSIRFSLPDPSNSIRMISYPPLYRPGIFERSFAEHSGYRFSLKQVY